MKNYLITTYLVLLTTVAQAQVGQLEIWIRAFIPDPANAGSAGASILVMPGGNPGSLVSVAGLCFKTDHRGFSLDPLVTSRTETKFVINPTSGSTAAIIPSSNISIASVSHRLNCSNGAVDASASGRINRDAVGTPAVAEGTIQVIGQVAATNVLTLLANAGPSIDYNFDLQWNPTSGRLVARVNYGSFPAFEMYVRRPGMAWVSIVNHLPSKTPLSLAGDAFGINTEIESVTLNIP